MLMVMVYPGVIRSAAVCDMLGRQYSQCRTVDRDRKHEDAIAVAMRDTLQSQHAWRMTVIDCKSEPIRYHAKLPASLNYCPNAAQVFKWEERKGWDVLVSAFLEEFSSAELVSLTLLTHPYHGDPDFAAQMHRWATEALGVPGVRPDCVLDPETCNDFPPA